MEEKDNQENLLEDQEKKIFAHGSAVEASSIIPKGKRLLLWTSPYQFIPYDIPKILQRESKTLSSDTVGVEDWDVLMDLPRWKVVSTIWDTVSNLAQFQLSRSTNISSSSSLWELPELKRFLRQRVPNTSNQSHCFAWLCLLATLSVTDDVVCRRQGTKSSLPPFAQDHFTDPDDEETMQLVIETWPLIQACISWEDFRIIHIQVRQQLHMVTVPHPLTKYATSLLFKLTDNEYIKSCKILRSFQRKDGIRRGDEFHDHHRLPHRLHASQEWLNLAANLPERVVGVLLQNPIEVLPVDRVIPTKQSCLPSSCLELVEIDPNGVGIAWVSLYDVIQRRQGPEEVWTVSTRPKLSNCECYYCRFNHNKLQSMEVTLSDLPEAKRLAHLLFQQGRFEDALTMYEKCHNSIKQKLVEAQAYAAADVWHSMAAVLLTQHHFARAQLHWKNGDIKYQHCHQEIREQLEKQGCYRYFENFSPVSINKEWETNIILDSSASERIFVAQNAIHSDVSSQLIIYAEEFALTHGWTTNRHHAVPTKDVPIHKVPKLLQWFQNWMRSCLFPLLSHHFGVSENHDISRRTQPFKEQRQQRQRFYVHDAFLVRYEATSASNFLPLHYDESTHSCVVALNDGFEGGGTYFYDLDKTLNPPSGSMISFRGNKVAHGGSPVIKGIRYILAIFLFLDDDITAFSESKGSDKILADTNVLSDTNAGKRKRDTMGQANGQSHEGKGAFTFSFF